MKRATFVPKIDTLEERSVPAVIGTLLTPTTFIPTITNASRYNVPLTINWEDGSPTERFIIHRKETLSVYHLYSVATTRAEITFDKAIKPGYQAQTYPLPQNSSFINVTWRLSGPGVDLQIPLPPGEFTPPGYNGPGIFF